MNEQEEEQKQEHATGKYLYRCESCKAEIRKYKPTHELSELELVCPFCAVESELQEIAQCCDVVMSEGTKHLRICSSCGELLL